MQLRPYQEAAKASILNEWEALGNRKTLLVLPTGTGKTIVFSSLAEELVRRGEKVLILAHREELLQQAADKLEKLTGLMCAVEKAESTAEDTWYRITVGSVQTLMREKRQSRFESDHYQTIIVDEAHHALAESYQKIFSYFDKAKVLGVTATADRTDRRNLGEFFDSLAYEYTLPKAIKDGFLSRIKALTIPINIDLRNVGVQSGDYKVNDLSDALAPYLEAIAAEMAEHCRDRKTLVFLPLIATSQKMAEILRGHGFRSGEVNGESPDRAQKLKDFSEGKYNVLCNSMLLTEGYDEPTIDCVVVLRPTKSRSLYSQMIGRGTRLSEGKDNLLILDFLWHTEKHELCRPANLICDNQELASKVTEILAESKAGADIEDAMEQGKLELVNEREAALAQKLSEMKSRKRQFVDPLQFEYSIQAEDLIDYEPTFPHEMAPPSKNQLSALEKFGIFPDEIQNSGFASKLIDRLLKRKNEGLSTPKQIRFLEKVGFPHVGTWEFAEARKMIDRIAANAWHVPRGIVPQNYQPEKVNRNYDYDFTGSTNNSVKSAIAN